MNMYVWIVTMNLKNWSYVARRMSLVLNVMVAISENNSLCAGPNGQGAMGIRLPLPQQADVLDVVAVTVQPVADKR